MFVVNRRNPSDRSRGKKLFENRSDACEDKLEIFGNVYPTPRLESDRTSIVGQFRDLSEILIFISKKVRLVRFVVFRAAARLWASWPNCLIALRFLESVLIIRLPLDSRATAEGTKRYLEGKKQRKQLRSISRLVVKQAKLKQPLSHIPTFPTEHPSEQTGDSTSEQTRSNIPKERKHREEGRNKRREEEGKKRGKKEGKIEGSEETTPVTTISRKKAEPG